MGLKLCFQLVNVVRLKLGGSHPFFHGGQCHDGFTLRGAGFVQRDVVGQKARHHGGVHRVCHAG